MPGWKTHQRFGLFSYGIYIVALLPGPEYAAGTALLCIPVAIVGSKYPDVLDPPNNRKHRARGHSKQRLKKYFKLTLILYPVSLFVPFVIPVMAYLIGYISHLIADSTTPSGLTSYPGDEKILWISKLFSKQQTSKGAAVSTGSGFNSTRHLPVPRKTRMKPGGLKQKGKQAAMTFRDLNRFLLHARGWEKDPRSGGKALYGLAVRLSDIEDNMPIKYCTVSINSRGAMQYDQRRWSFEHGAMNKYFRAHHIDYNKNIETVTVADGDRLREDLVYLDNSYASKDPTRLSNLNADTTGVAVKFI